MEEWKDIQGYEGLYQVSNLGRVKRLDGYVKTGIKHSEVRLCKGRILKQNLKRNGYLTVDLSKEYKVKTISVHRLVAFAFCYKPDGKEVVDHINTNKQDNRAVNLEWVSPEENRRRAKENHLYYNPHKKPIYCKELNKTFESSYKVAEYLNQNVFKNSKQIKAVASKIRACCNGLQNKEYGFKWVYV